MEDASQQFGKEPEELVMRKKQHNTWCRDVRQSGERSGKYVARFTYFKQSEALGCLENVQLGS